MTVQAHTQTRPVRDFFPRALPLAESCPAALSRFDHVRWLVQLIPEHGVPFRLSCHALCFALATQVKDLTVVRGQFGGELWAHSWLETRDRKRTWIIDPYPWAALGGPLMALKDPRVPWVRLYQASADPLPEPDQEQVSWLLDRWRAWS